MKKSITIGTPVEFDSEHGPQRGTVADIKANIATVKVVGTLSNMPWTVPVNELQRVKAAA